MEGFLVKMKKLQVAVENIPIPDQLFYIYRHSKFTQE